MGGQSGNWTPTKRRGPIAAEFQGPGPAAIVLPSLFGSEYQARLQKIMRDIFIFGTSRSFCKKLTKRTGFIYISFVIHNVFFWPYARTKTHLSPLPPPPILTHPHEPPKTRSSTFFCFLIATPVVWCVAPLASPKKRQQLWQVFVDTVPELPHASKMRI